MKFTTRELVKMAMYLALFVALDFITGRYLPTMPQGGSLGLSTMVLIIASFDLGIPKAFLLGALALWVSHLFDSPYFVNFFQYVLDYFIGYTAYSLARGFGKEERFLLPILATNAIRFFSSAVAGVLYYGVPWVGSFLYQAGYIVPTIIVSLIILPLVYPRIKKMLKSETVGSANPLFVSVGWALAAAMIVAILYSGITVYMESGLPGILGS